MEKEELLKLITDEAYIIEEDLQNLFDEVSAEVSKQLSGLDVDISEPVKAKLYELSGSNVLAQYGEDEANELFQEFAENEWRMFTEYVEEMNCELDFVGSTSSFYIVPKVFKDTGFDRDVMARAFDNPDFNELAEMAIGEPNPHYLGHVVLPVEISGTTVEAIEPIEAYNEDEIDEELFEALNSSTEIVFEELEIGFDDLVFLLSGLRNVGMCYDYLETFLANQVENFEAYMDAR